MLLHLKNKLLCSLVFLVLALATYRVCAQDDADVVINNMPLENVIAERDLAFRLRAETQLTDDSDDLIDEDPGYARFPTEMYAGEIKLYHKTRSTFSFTYDAWENSQDLDEKRSGYAFRTPVGLGIRALLKYRHRETEGTRDKDYYYLALSRNFPMGIYSYTQYRFSKYDEGDDGEDQVSQYLSWTPSSRYRAGFRVALSENRNSGEDDPWYARLFGTVYILEDLTSLRFQGSHYNATDEFDYQEYKAYLYQRIAGQSFLRLGYRRYEDSSDLYSDAYGIKAKRFFSASFSGHVGYRFYDHSTQTDFDTLYLGFGMIL